uniref:Uncharacterized protein n=1 Tax=Solanum lycopersicum TaxID=4081 RepID=K4BJ90_SOLLC
MKWCLRQPPLTVGYGCHYTQQYSSMYPSLCYSTSSNLCNIPEFHFSFVLFMVLYRS